MTTYISMLRGINVGKHKKVNMEDLRKLYESLNLKDVKTYIKSGNVVFQDHEHDSSKLTNEIENEITKRFDFNVSVLLRTENELKTIIEKNPFKNEDINKLYVTFMANAPSEKLIDEKSIDEIAKIKNKSEKFSISKKEIYLFLPGVYRKTKLSNNFFEKKLEVSATTRNWKTLNKLFDIANRTNK